MGLRNPRTLASATLLLGLFGAGLALGWARPILPGGSAAKEIRGFVRDLGGEIASDRADALWDRLSPRTREILARSHAALLRGAADYESRRVLDRTAENAVRLIEREYGMDVAALARTTPRDLWASGIRRRLGTPEDRAYFASLRIDRAETDGARARVWAVLPDGRPQGMHIERLEGRWWLADFVPYGEMNKMERPAPRDAAAASAVPGPVAATPATPAR